MARRRRPQVEEQAEDVQAKQKAAIIHSLENGATVTQAAAAAGVDRRTAQRWHVADLGFAAEWDAALVRRIGTVEDSLYVNAVKGNVTAQIFFLCNRSPGRWRHVQHIMHGGEVSYQQKADLTALVQAARENGHGAADTIERRRAFLGGPAPGAN